jgi:hypothetical protein
MIFLKQYQKIKSINLNNTHTHTNKKQEKRPTKFCEIHLCASVNKFAIINKNSQMNIFY